MLEKLEAHIEDNDGYCTYCKEWTTEGGVEPDARGYLCDECGNETVVGAEEVLFMGLDDAIED